MVDKHIEYKAEILKLTGIAMFTPTGRFFFEPVKLLKECDFIMYFIYLLMTIFFARIGFICIMRGYKLLEKHDESKS